MIVLAVLDVIPAHNPDLAQVRILLPLFPSSVPSRCRCLTPGTHVKEVDLLEEFLLVVLELADHGELKARQGAEGRGRSGCTRAPTKLSGLV